MTQLKTIPKDVELVIFDCYDTLIHADLIEGKLKTRKGLEDLLNFLSLKKIKLAIASDSDEKSIIKVISQENDKKA